MRSMATATVLFGPERPRRWSEDERRRLLAMAFAPGAVVTQVARDNDVSTSMIYKWRQEARAERAARCCQPKIMWLVTEAG